MASQDRERLLADWQDLAWEGKGPMASWWAESWNQTWLDIWLTDNLVRKPGFGLLVCQVLAERKNLLLDRLIRIGLCHEKYGSSALIQEAR